MHSAYRTSTVLCLFVVVVLWCVAPRSVSGQIGIQPYCCPSISELRRATTPNSSIIASPSYCNGALQPTLSFYYAVGIPPSQSQVTQKEVDAFLAALVPDDEHNVLAYTTHNYPLALHQCFYPSYNENFLFGPTIQSIDFYSSVQKALAPPVLSLQSCPAPTVLVQRCNTTHGLPYVGNFTLVSFNARTMQYDVANVTEQRDFCSKASTFQPLPELTTQRGNCSKHHEGYKQHCLWVICSYYDNEYGWAHPLIAFS